MVSKNKPQRHLVGSFNVSKEEGIMVCDPCYEDGDKEINHVKSGKWLCYIERGDGDFGLGVRNVSLSIIHESITNPGVIDSPLGMVMVDSGQVGMYAKQGWEEKRPSEDDYDRVCETTLSTPISAGMVEYGVTSSSGYGDGAYSLYGLIENKKTVALEVVFISQPGDPRNWENEPSDDESVED